MASSTSRGEAAEGPVRPQATYLVSPRPLQCLPHLRLLLPTLWQSCERPSNSNTYGDGLLCRGHGVG